MIQLSLFNVWLEPAGLRQEVSKPLCHEHGKLHASQARLLFREEHTSRMLSSWAGIEWPEQRKQRNPTIHPHSQAWSTPARRSPLQDHSAGAAADPAATPQAKCPKPVWTKTKSASDRPIQVPQLFGAREELHAEVRDAHLRGDAALELCHRGVSCHVLLAQALISSGRAGGLGGSVHGARHVHSSSATSSTSTKDTAREQRGEVP